MGAIEDQYAGAVELASISNPVSITLARDTGRLYDPVKGETALEVSGAHSSGATTLVIAPQASYTLAGTVPKDAAITITGDPTAYAATGAVTVDSTAPETLSIGITPALTAGLTGGEVVTIAASSAVTYSYAQSMGRKAAISLGWDVVAGSSMWKIPHSSGTREPAVGDIASGGVVGQVTQRETYTGAYSVVMISQGAGQ